MLSPEVLPAVFDSAPDAMLIVGSAGEVLYASERACSLFGYAAGELSGCSIEELMPERFRQAHVHQRFRFSNEKRARPMGTGLELVARRKDGAEVPVEISLSPICCEGGTFTVAAVRDVTERKQVLADLVAARQQADDARRSADEARAAADRANQAKSRFLAAASHDLRQPLQSLTLLSATLRRLIKERHALEALSSQEQAIAAMSGLLIALLEISRLESGSIEPVMTDFPLDGTLASLRTEFSQAATARGIALEIPGTPLIAHSAPALIDQILRHLLSNGIKYTNAGWVRLTAASQPPDIRVDVEDTGIGMAAGELPRIYDEFYQIGVSPTAPRNGYGLGLTIVSKLVELLKLKLEVRSTPGRGSIFSLTLPMAEAARVAASAADAAPMSERAPAGPKVLVLEKDGALCEAMRLLLKTEGYCVLTAASLAAALQLARREARIEVLLLQDRLPDGVTGAQAITALREIIGPRLGALLLAQHISTSLRALERDGRVQLATSPIGADALVAKLQALRRT